MAELLRRAQTGSYAVGSFDVPDLETAQGVLDAALAEDSPVILAVSESFLDVCPLEPLVTALRAAADPLPIPVALLFDHGRDYANCRRAVAAGLTSVMFDGSRLSWEENVALTAQLVEECRPLGVSVEGEIGQVLRSATTENIERHLTRPDEAEAFARLTGVDALAIAVGTAHGQYRGEPRIHYDVISAVRRRTDVPLVLHGGSDTGDAALRECVRQGISKINIYTDLSVRALDSIGALLASGRPVRINDALRTARDSFRKVAAHYLRVFGSAGQAPHGAQRQHQQGSGESNDKR